MNAREETGNAVDVMGDPLPTAAQMRQAEERRELMRQCMQRIVDNH